MSVCAFQASLGYTVRSCLKLHQKNFQEQQKLKIGLPDYTDIGFIRSNLQTNKNKLKIDLS